MPLPDLTAQQREALGVLRWLHDSGDASRRTGRTTALAVVALWLAVEREGEWVEVPADHALFGARGRGYVAEYAEAMGRELGLELERRERMALRVVRATTEARVWLAGVMGPGVAADRPEEGEPEEPEAATCWERLGTLEL